MTNQSPILSLCMIVRDSAATLPACLASIRPWVDELVVVDTGSVDDTREIARQFGVKIFEFPWIDDFAAARNESLKHATGQWLFWMDSDDTIDAENGRKLRELAYTSHADNILGYVIQVHCPSPTSGGGDETTVVDHVKLVRNHHEIRFEGRIHEQVLPSIRRLGMEVGWTDLFVVHSGADHSPEAKQRKYERDLRILQKDLADRPNHPFVLFNLGMTYDDMGQHREAEIWLRKSLAVSDPGESHVRKVHALLASSLDRQGKSHEAHEICRRGLELFPEDEELLFRVGVLEHRAQNLEAAIRSFRIILNHQGQRHFSSVDRGITGYKARHNLALVYEDSGRLDLAELQWRRIAEVIPAYQPANSSLRRLLSQQGRSATLLTLQSLHPMNGNPQIDPAAGSTPRGGSEDLQAADQQPIRQSTGQEAPADPSQQFLPDDSPDWPACASRRIFASENRVIRLCAHPNVACHENVVSMLICQHCESRLGPVPARFRELRPPTGKVRCGPCAYLGQEIGQKTCEDCGGNVRIKVFVCGHPLRVTTTFNDCLMCPDYEPAQVSPRETELSQNARQI